MKLVIKYCLVITFQLLIFQNNFAQSVFDDYENEIVIKNHIKSKSHTVIGSPSNYKSLQVLYNEKGDVVEETSFRSTGRVAVKRNYKYDSEGNVIEYQSYDGQRDKITYKKFVKYDHNGNKISEVGFDGVDRFDNKYVYDSQNRLQEIRYYVSDNLIERRELKYGANNEILIFKADNSLSERQVKTFDNRKNLLKEVTFSGTGTEKKRIEYEYDNLGNMVSETKYYGGKITEKRSFVYEGKKLMKIYAEAPGVSKYLDREYIYDAAGKLSQEKWIDKSTKKFSTKDYKYDSRGNAISIESYFATYDFDEDVKITYSYF